MNLSPPLPQFVYSHWPFIMEFRWKNNALYVEIYAALCTVWMLCQNKIFFVTDLPKVEKKIIHYVACAYLVANILSFILCNLIFCELKMFEIEHLIDWLISSKSCDFTFLFCWLIYLLRMIKYLDNFWTEKQ